MTYHDMTLLEAERTTLREFGYLRKKHVRRMQERDYEMYLGAWLNHVVKSKKTVGKSQKYVYGRFTDFYDVEEERKKAIYGKSYADAKVKEKENMIKMNKILNRNRNKAVSRESLEEQSKRLEEVLNK